MMKATLEQVEVAPIKSILLVLAALIIPFSRAQSLAPDLVVNDITWNTSPVGGPITFTARVINQGSAPTPSDAGIGVLFKVDGNIVSWRENAGTSLAAGGALLISATDGPNGSHVWYSTSGSHRVSAMVDDLSAISESDESNNLLIKSFSVAAADPAVLGQWSQVYRLVPAAYDSDDDHRSAFVPIHMAVLPNGKVLSWGRDPQDVAGSNGSLACDPSLSFLWDPAQPAGPATVFDPARGTSPLVDCLFCAGQCFLPDGRLLVAGGHIQDGRGLNATHVFDYRTNAWTKSVNNMLAGRWYPTTTALPGGTVLVGGGTDEAGGMARPPEIWETNASTPFWRSLSGLSNLPDAMGYYPWLFVAPNGNLFWAGNGPTTGYIDISGSGTWPFQGWTTTTNFNQLRNHGSAVQSGDGKILILGGYPNDNIEISDATATAEIIDLNQANPAWRTVAPMHFPRAYGNTTLLPDGTVLVTGGTSLRNNNYAGAIYQAELWNPQTETFTQLASSSVPRMYHSVAVLLPDGRVASGGGGMWPYRPIVMGSPYRVEGAHPDVEIFSPPYLFKGARPSIASAPRSVGYGQKFFLQTSNAQSIHRVNLVRLSAVTHSFNQNQRFNRLSFSRVSNGLNVTGPGSPQLCPPGDYMLFILNNSGVPSVAAFVNIQ